MTSPRLSASASYVSIERISHSLRAPLNISPVEDDRLVIGIDSYARDLAKPVEVRCPVVQLHLKRVPRVIISAEFAASSLFCHRVRNVVVDFVQGVILHLLFQFMNSGRHFLVHWA